MLDYLIAISLILLTFGHALLIRGCFDINKKLLPLNGEAGAITEKVGGIHLLIDELCEILSELADSGGPTPSRPTTQTGASIPEMLLAGLMNRVASEEGYGGKTQTEWPIQKENDSEAQNEQIQESD